VIFGPMILYGSVPLMIMILVMVFCVTLSWDLLFCPFCLCSSYLGPLSTLCFFLLVIMTTFDVTAYQFICFGNQARLTDEIWN